MIRDWLPHFLGRLTESFAPHDWPDPGTHEWRVFVMDFHRAFARHGVSEAEADEARSLLTENPPRFKADYIPKVVGAVRIHRELTGGGAAPGAMDDRETALHASKTCIRCFGEGLAIVYASKPSVERRIPETVAAYCVCPYGQWVERTHREKAPDVWKRIPHLANVLAGKSFWRLDPPGFEGLAASTRPAEGVADLLRTWTDAAREEDARPAPAPPRPRPDLGHVEPAIPIPPKPVPEPDPAVLDEREESYRWL